MNEAPKLLLAHHLKTLKLPTVLREYDKVAQQCAAEGLDHVQFLARLVELELIDRERRMTLRAATRCPSGLLDRRRARRLWRPQVGTKKRFAQAEQRSDPRIKDALTWPNSCAAIWTGLSPPLTRASHMREERHREMVRTQQRRFLSLSTAPPAKNKDPKITCLQDF